jgi:pyrroloquinoline-quinone synthase
MKHPELWSRIEAAISRHDLLQHPFYQAWTAGTLRTEDLRHYAREYYHQVAAFPTYLSTLHSRLGDGPLRRTVLGNLCEEEIDGTPHSELWLDFAEGMGAQREQVRESAPSPSTRALVDTFRGIAAGRSPLAALAALYAYESQVARIAGLKAEGLREKYSADAKTCSYFTLHSTWDVHHSKVWANQIDAGIDGNQLFDEENADEIVAAVEDAATAMWKSLDGIRSSCACTN